jgi:PAS domain S-box-containing protein
VATESNEALQERVRDLQARLEEAEETLRALRSGEVDAVVASGPEGDRVYTLKGADEAYRVMVENMAEGALTLTPGGLILFSNEQFATLLGVPLERVIGASVHGFVAEEDGARLSALLSGRAAAKAEVRLKSAAGALAPAQVSANTLSFDGTECVCLIVTDLTEQKRIQEIVAAERLARESESRLRSLGDNLPEGSIYRYLQDAEGKPRFEFISAGIERLTGVPAAEILRDAAAVVRTIEPEDVERFQAAVTRSREHLTRFEMEVRHRHRATGELRWSLLRSMPFRRRGDGSTVWDGIQIDITERKHREEELRVRENQLLQAQKMESIGVLAGGIAHDFNNLLTGVIGNAGLVMEEMPAWDRNRAPMLELIASAKRAADLTRQLLAYAGKGRFFIQPVNLSKSVREMMGLLRGAVPAIIEIDVELAEEIAPVEMDASQLHQIVMNLVLNASEAIGDRPGRITVQTKMQDVDAAAIEESRLDIPAGTYVSLEVQDTGSGMDEATKARIFEPFFTTKFTGRGLGLAAVHGIVRAHQGAVLVYSNPGKGTQFTVLLPAAGAAVPQEPAIAKAPDLRGQGTILVVDDEEVVLSVAKAALERFGYSVLQARNGIEAVEIFGQTPQKICAVLLDLTMPLMSGEETLHRLRAIRADVPVLLSSGYDEVEVIKRFAGQGLAGFVGKPYSTAELVGKIKSVCAGPSKRDEE